MADLGLSQLDDDQLVDLLNQAVGEILSRDPVVHRIAQKGIIAAADKQKLFVDALQKEVADARNQYLKHVEQDVRSEIVRAVQAGELDLGKVVGIQAETKVIVDVTKEQIAKMKADLSADPSKASFEVRYDGRIQELRCSYHSAGQNWDAKRNVSGNPHIGKSVRTAVLAAFGIPAD